MVHQNTPDKTELTMAQSLVLTKVFCFLSMYKYVCPQVLHKAQVDKANDASSSHYKS